MSTERLVTGLGRQLDRRAFLGSLPSPQRGGSRPIGVGLACSSYNPLRLLQSLCAEYR